MKKRILLLTHSMCNTGAPKVVCQFFRAKPDDWEVRVIADRSGELRGEFGKIGPVTVVSESFGGKSPFERRIRLLRWRRYVRALRLWQPHLVYVNSVAGLPLVNYLELADALPVVAHVHEMPCAIRQVLFGQPEATIRRPLHYIAVSAAVANGLVDEFSINTAQISVVPAFVDVHKTEQQAAEQVQNSVDGTLVVGGSGIPIWTKGVENWLRLAFELVKLMGRDRLKMEWIGPIENPDGLAFHRMLYLLGLRGVVDLRGYLDNPFPYYRRFHVFAHTSWEDACPLAVLENMLLGTPVVTFAGSGGAAELVREAGIVIGDFDVAAMARAILELWQDPPRYEQMVRAGRERAIEHYSAEKVVPQLLGIIDRLLRGREMRCQ